ncbi:F-box associated domain-containing protein [Caenorhabditis elegans]|uniref:F-box associated domain-containing protein n=1 Tax=Caenorhabditis elegans TaxID=6239 RepID=O02110_CAEEL|nr:F-box associated domain-containing protein [Caenorhabditis elegans]CCD63939.1 F-box associated domain-containing protein [Caenorhabditis elegans]|eukprot:NP_493763.1 F-box B protein [Caenorhabditis elegans]
MRGSEDEIEIPHLTLIKFLDHIHEVLHQNRQIHINLENGMNEEIKTICSLFENRKIASCSTTSTEVQGHHLFGTHPENLEIVVVPIRKELLVQNYEELKVTNLTLNEVFLSNSRTLRSLHHSMTAKDVNLFLKIWIQNSQLRISDLVVDGLNIEHPVHGTILRGIDFTRYEDPLVVDDGMVQHVQIVCKRGIKAKVSLTRTTVRFVRLADDE